MRVRSLEVVKQSPARLQAYPASHSSANACSETAQKEKEKPQTKAPPSGKAGVSHNIVSKIFIIIEPKFPLE